MSGHTRDPLTPSELARNRCSQILGVAPCLRDALLAVAALAALVVMALDNGGFFSDASDPA